MPKNQFTAQLKKELQQPAQLAFQHVIDKLKEIAKALEQGFPKGQIKTAVEPGFSAAVLGQQFNVVLLIDRPNRSTFRDVLFRAYVSSTGFPVHLDLYGEELARCADETALEDRILEFFRRPETKSRLQALQEFAAGS